MPPAQRRSSVVPRLARISSAPYPSEDAPLRVQIRHRSGSTRPRGVLKEIEWWKVQVGQLQEEATEDVEEGEEVEDDGEVEVEESVETSRSDEEMADRQRVLPVSPLGDAFGEYPLLDETKSFVDPPSFVECTPTPSPPSSPLMTPPPLSPTGTRGHRRRRSAFARAATYAGLGSFSPQSSYSSSESRASPDPETKLRELLDLPSR